MTKTKRMFVLAIAALSFVMTPACDIQNPASVTLESADPTLLIRGARSKFSDAQGMVAGTFPASDEGFAKSASVYEDQSGDISTATAYPTWFSQMHQARILAEDAVTRSDALKQTENGYLARVWHAWMLVRLGELFGNQPFDGGDTVTVAAMYAEALPELETASASAVDSTRHRAWAGIARINYNTGKPTVDRAKLQAAIDNAQKVLAQKPTFVWFETPNFNPLGFAMGRSYGPTTFYHDIPLWFAGFPANAGHDATLVYADLTKPQGIVLISADELRLIQAESHLLLGDVNAAKTALKLAPLLPKNHVRVCGKDPKGAALTAAQIAECVVPMTAAQVLVAIQSLQREDQYLSLRRSVTDTGVQIMPFKLPRNA